MLFRIIAFTLLIGAAAPLPAQEAFHNALPSSDNEKLGEPLPASAWLDLRQNAPGNSTPQSAPRWVESVTMVPAQTTGGPAPKSIFRIRVAQPSGDYQVLFFRLFFDDKAEQRPELIVWDESGTQVLRSGELGSGIGLPRSDSLMIPMSGVAAIDIEVPGDGKTVRGAYLDWMTSSEVVHPLNAEHRDVIPEPFHRCRPWIRPHQTPKHFALSPRRLPRKPFPSGRVCNKARPFNLALKRNRCSRCSPLRWRARASMRRRKF